MFCNFSASFEQKNEVTRLSPLVTFNITTFAFAQPEQKLLDKSPAMDYTNTTENKLY